MRSIDQIINTTADTTSASPSTTTDIQQPLATKVANYHTGMPSKYPNVINTPLFDKSPKQLPTNHILAIKNHFELLNCSNDTMLTSSSKVQAKQATSPLGKLWAKPIHLPLHPGHCQSIHTYLTHLKIQTIIVTLYHKLLG